MRKEKERNLEILSQGALRIARDVATRSKVWGVPPEAEFKVVGLRNYVLRKDGKGETIGVASSWLEEETSSFVLVEASYINSNGDLITRKMAVEEGSALSGSGLCYSVIK